ncbi:MAG: T9SS type A sorting domain-containing protein [Flavobacteriales bacterium]|nr:T9SS type A sorting domain-containing protein [Flavobacteriales bacterium]
MNFTKASFTALAFCSVTFFSYAQFGVLDPTFGNNGIVETEFGQYVSEEVREMLIQPDGKIVVCGTDYVDSYDFMLLRYNSDGSLDVDFGDNGKATFHYGESFTHNYGIAVVMQQDGKFVVAGYSETSPAKSFTIMRANADGTIDTSFGDDGVVTVFIDDYDAIANDVMLQPDGKIIVVGHANVNAAGEDMAAIRLNEDGSFDDTFGVDGVVANINDVCGVSLTNCVLQTDGKILISGYGSTQSDHVFCIMRLNDDGAFDTTFNGDGIQMTGISGFYNHPLSMLVQPDGNILLAGYAGQEASAVSLAMVRYTSTGNLDATFGLNGIFFNSINAGSDWISDICLQPDGKILGCGLTTLDEGGWDFVVFRFNSNGTFDSTFDDDGIVNTAFTKNDSRAEAIALQDDGKVVAAGYAQASLKDAVLARYNGIPIGIEEASNNTESLHVFPNPASSFLQVDFDKTSFPVHISVINSSGRTCLNALMNAQCSQINVQSLLQGIYIIECTNARGEKERVKWVKE